MDHDLENLEFLSLISKISNELLNHTGIDDKVLAEFIISLHCKSSSLASFQKKLSKVGAEFPQSFVENMDRLIKALIPPGMRARLSKPKKTAKSNWDTDAPEPSQFPGLSIKDDPERLKKLMDQDVNDTMADLDSLARQHPTESSSKNQNPFSKRKRRSVSPTPKPCAPAVIDDYVVQDKIYSGTVTGIKDFGVFIGLSGVRERTNGMVHISCLRQGSTRVGHPSEVVALRDAVKVKVISIAGKRIGLSMKDVDQKTGRDLTLDGYAPDRLGSGFVSAQVVTIDDSGYKKPKKRISSPERFEIKQLIASGVLNARDYPDIDDEGALDYENLEEEFDVEVKEDEPAFLAGQTKSSLNLSPIKIVKNPDGTMNRAALAGAGLAKERRELRQQQAILEREKEELLANEANNPQEAGFRKSDNVMPEWRKKIFGKATTFGKITNLSIKEQREQLPIFKLRETIIKAVDDNQIMVIVGETGSGKTTQMTQYLAEAGYTSKRMVGCTQPRRVAAMSVAKRVAEEVGCRVGQEVGYTIRFEDCTSQDTKIKYMTDGMLLRECLIDPLVSKYSVLLLDEAHERTVSTDVLFGLLKKAIKARPDLKLIVTSATLDAERFSSYFFNCPILTIPGRTYPVEVLYAKDPEPDYMDSALVTTMQIHLSEPPGDILLFLTGQEEIDTASEILFERMKALGPMVPELIILPVYSALPSEMQSKIFEPAPPGSRKVVLATNIAETSITIDGIFYVIDPGFVKQNTYDPKLGMDALIVVPISQAQARQRAGRAGRTGPGKYLEC